MIQCKPVDEPVAADDGRRVLVDRLWPHNWPKAPASLHAWLPDLAPAIDLHKRFTAGELDFVQFAAVYRQALAAQPAHWWALLPLAETGTLTLVFTAQDPLQNHAVVLAQWLEEALDRSTGSSSPVCYRDEFPDY
ncbi:DUF488 domain-containing protein [Pseudomonas mohnii]